MTGYDVRDRAEALAHAVEAAGGTVSDDLLAPARALARRCADRLGLAGDHTVAVLAGPTGAGKSSLFNLLAGMGLADVGVVRPTTVAAHACVWGAAGTAADLLDWLDVPPELRFQRESALDGEDQAALRGLVLLDLPDVDSVVAGHRDEADRLLGLADLIIWVTDPQKYADHAAHDRYLRAFRPYRDAVTVVLNQIDTLDEADVDPCVVDLGRLLETDRLRGVPVLSTSAVSGVGLAGLRELLEKAVASRASALVRHSGELDAVTAKLAEEIAPVPAGRVEWVGRAAATVLCDAVREPGAAAGREHGRRVARVLGWPPVPAPRSAPVPAPRSVSAATEPDPPGSPAGGQPDPAAGRTGSGRRPEAGERLARAVRRLADDAAGGLPAPWRVAVAAAAQAHLPSLPDELDRVVNHVTGTIDHPEPREGRRRTAAPEISGWWRAFGWIRTLFALAALAGAAILLASLAAPGLPAAAGVVPLAGGLAAWLLATAVAVPLVATAARRRGGQVRARIDAAVGALAEERIAQPVRAVLDRCSAAAGALARAGRDGASVPGQGLGPGTGEARTTPDPAAAFPTRHDLT